MICNKLHPLTFHPIFKERIWGGENMKRLFKKSLPDGSMIGESWEIVDRKDDVNVVKEGALKGVSLRKLIEEKAEEMMGEGALLEGRFPLIFKILDAKKRLSLQVHPPRLVAEKLHGEPKTELWYLADCQDQSELFVGLRKGVDRIRFEREIEAGSIVDCLHRIRSKKGEAIFLPSGRIHAIGAGNVIFEVQQNSDTTYRIYDWKRVGFDGKKRQLHLSESLMSIDFEDHEPSFVSADWEPIEAGVKGRCLADCDAFFVKQIRLSKHTRYKPKYNAAVVFACVSGNVICRGNDHEIMISSGQFCLLPASVKADFQADDDSDLTEMILTIVR